MGCPTYCHTNRTWKAEENIWPDKGLHREVTLGDVEAKAEGHHRLMGDHRNEHRHHVTGAVLQSDSKALEGKCWLKS